MLPKLKITLSSPISILKFPHFIRKIHAGPVVRIFDHLLWYIVISFIVLNLFHAYLFTPGQEEKLQRQIIKNPFESTLHENLGQYYLAVNEEEAAKEYALAEDLYQKIPVGGDKILGSRSSPSETWNTIRAERQRLEKAIAYWEKVHQAFPDYLYSKAKIATLAYQLGHTDKAREYIALGIAESPANELLLTLSRELK